MGNFSEYLSSGAKWNLKILTKHKVIGLKRYRGHCKDGTKLFPEPAGIINGTMYVLL
jgi:hypothetical protein